MMLVYLRIEVFSTSLLWSGPRLLLLGHVVPIGCVGVRGACHLPFEQLGAVHLHILTFGIFTHH